MKIIASLGLAALSLASLHAADPPAPAAPVPADARRWGHDGPMHERMMHGWGRGEMMHRGMKDECPKGSCGQAAGDKCGHPLADALQLTDEQKAKAKELMEAAKPKIEAIREEARTKIKAVLEESMAQLRPLLTPEQQAVFDDLQKLKTDKAALKPTKPAPEAKTP